MIFFNGVPYGLDDFRGKFRGGAVKLKDDRSLYLREITNSMSICQRLDGTMFEMKTTDFNNNIASTTIDEGWYCLWFGDRLIGVTRARMLPERQHHQSLCGSRVKLTSTSYIENRQVVDRETLDAFGSAGCTYTSLLTAKYPTFKQAADLIADGLLENVPLGRDLLLCYTGALKYYEMQVPGKRKKPDVFELTADFSMREELAFELDRLGIKYEMV